MQPYFNIAVGCRRVESRLVWFWGVGVVLPGVAHVCGHLHGAGFEQLGELRAAGDNARDRDAEVAQRVAQFVLFF